MRRRRKRRRVRTGRLVFDPGVTYRRGYWENLVARLSDSERKLLELLFIHDMTIQDAAARLGLPVPEARETRARSLATVHKWRQHDSQE